MSDDIQPSARRTIADFLIGAAWASLTVFIALALLQLAGCANGVVMSEAETIACRNEGCAVFTERELLQLVNKAATNGYRSGWRDALKQSGKDL